MADEHAPPYETTTEGLRLRSTRCVECDTAAFPRADSCPQCGSEKVVEELLPASGRLWSWTTQSVRPKSPPYGGAESVDEYVPFLVGYLQFPGGLCVEGRLTGFAEQQPVIGAPMSVAEVVMANDAGGNPINMYAFAPAVEESN